MKLLPQSDLMQVFSLTITTATTTTTAAAGQSESLLWQLLLIPLLPLKVVKHPENDSGVCFDTSFMDDCGQC